MQIFLQEIMIHFLLVLNSNSKTITTGNKPSIAMQALELQQFAVSEIRQFAQKKGVPSPQNADNQPINLK